jgi:transaldolase / glucose-6-phosphate isomerase
VPPEEDPAVQLGVAIGVAATQLGRDKMTVIASPGIVDLSAWLEQFPAQSTGEQGYGPIPPAREPLGVFDRYGNDRFFAYLELTGENGPAQRAAVAAPEKAGHQIARISVQDTWDAGQEFFRWEFATAVPAAIIGIDRFDQPDVEASKDKTSALTEGYEKAHNLPEETPVFHENGLALHADPRDATEFGQHNMLTGHLKSHLGRVHAGAKSGEYVAWLAYIERNQANTQVLTTMRVRTRDKTCAGTCVGFGPHFQHSTEKAHRGGPNPRATPRTLTSARRSWRAVDSALT